MATATFTQTERPLAVTTPLGKDAFLIIGMSGHEAICDLFRFSLELLAENKRKVPFEKLMGQDITVSLRLPNGKPRFFSGICNHLAECGRDDVFTVYRMQVVPKFWLLTKRAQSRIFQHISVPEILKKVLEGLDVAFEIQGKFEPRDFCVQYRESDYNFACRLMEEEGIYYFFKHSEKGHKLVLGNTDKSHPPMPEKSTVHFVTDSTGNKEEGRVQYWHKVQELRSGKCTVFDHSFELPHKHLEAEKTILDSVKVGTVDHKLKVGGNDKLELYDYPGAYAQRFDGIDKGGGEQPAELQKIFTDNKRTVEIRMQQETTPGIGIQGSSDCRQFVSGHKFTLAEHFDADGDYLLVSTDHEARQVNYRSGGGTFFYQNGFTAIPFALPYKPASLHPRPIVDGCQTAVVVGPPGEEIFTDKFGRVKVQFHWDREGKNNADSSCWIRVGQLWAGKRWGASFWPRIGQEVIVDFLEGDPDQPIIVGSVYNADQMPPYLGDGPDSKHKKDNKVSGIKSNTTLGGKGFNEWRFDDNKGKEQIFIHAERDMDQRVKNESRERIISNRHLIVGFEKDGKKGGDQNEKVFQDKNLHILRHQQEKIEGNMFLTIGKGQADDGGHQEIVIEKDKFEHIGGTDQLHVDADQFVAVDGTQQLTVKKDKLELLKANNHLHVMGNRNEKVDGAQSLTVGGNQQEKVGQNHALDAGMQIHLKAGMTVVIEAGTQLSLKVGGNFIDINPGGVFIQGTMVMINSGGAAGSGSGSSPTAPTDPNLPRDANEAKPPDPAEADDSVTGTKSAPG
jgi:type VI secretion system secreted protein VgrG